MVNNPPILIFDEATSALDYESERIIQMNMSHIVKNRTVIVIAHRLAAVRPCNRIVSMIEGRIFEIGTHEELLEESEGLLFRISGRCRAIRRERHHERGSRRARIQAAAGQAQSCAARPIRSFSRAALEVIETPPSPVRMALILIICALVVAAIAWAWIGRIDIIAVAQGKIQPTGRVKVIEPLETGRVARDQCRQRAACLQGRRSGRIRPLARRSPTRRRRLTISPRIAPKSRGARRRSPPPPAHNFDPLPKIAWDEGTPPRLREREDAVLAADLNQLSAQLALNAAQRTQKQAEHDQLVKTIETQKRLIATLAGARRHALDFGQRTCRR